MLSLRGRHLKLLALRGDLYINRQPSTAIALHPGDVITLCEGVELLVEAISLPPYAVALAPDGSRPVILTADVYSLLTSPQPLVINRFLADAPAYVWSTGQGWTIQVGAAGALALAPGGAWTVEGRTFRAVRVEPDLAEQPGTINHRPMRIVARYDSVHIQREGRPPVILSGRQAQIMSELVACGGMLSWEALVREIYEDWRQKDRAQLRQRLDPHLSRLRKALKRAGLRDGILRADGRGHLEIVLFEGDVLVDET